jgi:putative membrane protein
VTGLLYMGISRLLWGSDIDVGHVAATAWFPFTVYAANLGFAMALSLSAGLWPPVALAALAGMLPAILATRPRWLSPLPSLAERTWRASPSR